MAAVGTRRLRVAIWAASAWAVTASVFVSVLAVNSTGEAARTKRIVEGQTARLEQDIRADCRFKMDIAQIAAPAFNARPSRVLLQIAHDAVEAYVGKGCPAAVNPKTGRPFGPPPSLPPVPPPTPTR